MKSANFVSQTMTSGTISAKSDAPTYLPTYISSADDYVATNDVWNHTGMLPKVGSTQNSLEDRFERNYHCHIVGFAAKNPNQNIAHSITVKFQNGSIQFNLLPRRFSEIQ